MLVEYRWGSKRSVLAEAASKSANTRAFVRRRGFVYVHGRTTPLWSNDEDEIVRLHYPDYGQLAKRLKRRTITAIKMRVRVLGVQRRVRIWTAADVSRLRRLWPHADQQAILDAFPGREWKTIKGAAEGRKLHRPKRRYASTGSDLLDSIRSRCAYLNYTMNDLDMLAGTGRYFRNIRWDRNSPEIGRMAKGIQALGGRISVSWGD
jgi:hypothetical protein